MISTRKHTQGSSGREYPRPQQAALTSGRGERPPAQVRRPLLLPRPASCPVYPSPQSPCGHRRKSWQRMLFHRIMETTTSTSSASSSSSKIAKSTFVRAHCPAEQGKLWQHAFHHRPSWRGEASLQQQWRATKAPAHISARPLFTPIGLTAKTYQGAAPSAADSQVLDPCRF